MRMNGTPNKAIPVRPFWACMNLQTRSSRPTRPMTIYSSAYELLWKSGIAVALVLALSGESLTKGSDTIADAKDCYS